MVDYEPLAFLRTATVVSSLTKHTISNQCYYSSHAPITHKSDKQYRVWVITCGLLLLPHLPLVYPQQAWQHSISTLPNHSLWPHTHFLMDKNLQPCLACHPSQSCLLVPLGLVFNLSSLCAGYVTERERRRLRIYCRIFVDIRTPVVLQIPLLNKLLCVCQGKCREFTQARWTNAYLHL